MKVIEEGVYFLYDGDELVYIGESDNVFRRIGQHIAEKQKTFDRFEVYPTKERRRLEGFLIRAFSPKYNISAGMNDFPIDDLFPSLSIQETIKKYEEYHGDPSVREIAESIGTYPQALLKGLYDAGAPIYKIGDRWRIDRAWYKENENHLWDYVP